MVLGLWVVTVGDTGACVESCGEGDECGGGGGGGDGGGGGGGEELLMGATLGWTDVIKGSIVVGFLRCGERETLGA